MAAFIVFIREKTRDQSEMDAYKPKASASLEGRPATVHALYGRQEVLEGPENEGVLRRSRLPRRQPAYLAFRLNHA
jgi:hypothetical protein